MRVTTRKKLARAAVFALCLALAASLMGAAGCKESDSIVEWVLDQSSSYVDKNNPDKFYVPDEAAKENIKDLNLDLSELQKRDRIKKDLPSKAGKHDRGKVKNHEKSARRGDGMANKEKSGGTDKSHNMSGKPSNKGKSSAGGSKGGKGAGNDKGEKKGPNAGRYHVNMGDDSYLTRTYDGSNGNVEDLPEDVSTVVASGKLATTVLMFGKEDSLLGTSKNYLGRKAVKTVFKKKLSKTKGLWGSDDSKLKTTEVESIISLKPSAVFVTSGQITAKQERLIAQNLPQCRVITLPALTSDSAIRTCVKAVGKMFTKTTGGESPKMASAYLKYIDDEVIKVALDAHPGGLVTYNAVDYSSTDATNIATVPNPSSEQLWTLYVSGWDPKARVTASYDGSVLFKDTGAAYTNTGWLWSPVSYYMSVGGVINNAAAYGPLSTSALQPVLQFNQNQVSYKWNNFVVDVNESKGGGSFTNYRAFYLLTNARDAAEVGGGNSPSSTHPLGSKDFNTIIVANKSIASSLKSAFKEKNGLYTKYGYVKTGSGAGYGLKCSGKKGDTIAYTTIKGDADILVLVNPCGYVESWADGSVESPLESLWIANKYWGLSSSVVKDKVNAFYKKFYGYDSVDVNKVLSGSYAR